MHALHHAARQRAPAAAVELVGVRLPAPVRAAARADRRPLRDREGRAAAPSDGGAHRPRRRCARRSSSTRSAGGACSDGRRTYQPPEAPLSRGLEVHAARTTAPATSCTCWVERGARAPRLRLERPGGRRGRASASAPTTRATTSSEPTVALAEREGRTRVRFQGNWFPHRLRPAADERHVLRRRRRRPLLPAVGRGDPDGVLLRHRLRPRDARGARGRAAPRGGARAVRRVQRRPRARVPPRAAACSGSSRRCRRACSPSA